MTAYQVMIVHKGVAKIESVRIGESFVVDGIPYSNMMESKAGNFQFSCGTLPLQLDMFGVVNRKYSGIVKSFEFHKQSAIDNYRREEHEDVKRALEECKRLYNMIARFHSAGCKDESEISTTIYSKMVLMPNVLLQVDENTSMMLILPNGAKPSLDKTRISCIVTLPEDQVVMFADFLKKYAVFSPST
jgi:hypothetical protein